MPVESHNIEHNRYPGRMAEWSTETQTFRPPLHCTVRALLLELELLNPNPQTHTSEITQLCCGRININSNVER